MRRRAIIAAGALSGAFVSGGWLMRSGLRAEHLVDQAQLFDQVMSHVDRYYVDTLSSSTLYQKALDGMLYELRDPHTVYLNTDRFRRLTESTTGRYGGVGIQIEPRDGWISVIAALPNSPAEKAGLGTGDRIVEVDGKQTKGWTSEEAQKVLRGTPGTDVAIVVEKLAGSRVPITLTRREIHLRSVDHAALVRPTIGYVEMRVFSESGEMDLRSAIDSLRRLGMTTLVLDLRGNPGGLLEQGVKISDLFLDPGQKVLSMRGRTHDANAEFFARAKQPWPDMPLVVLVDGTSASASEIVAGALQDHDRALLIGVPTYGKGSAQSLIRLGDGALKLTTSRWYTPTGRSIDSPHRQTSRIRDEDAEEGTERGEPTASRPRFSTDAGRTVLGGGGITPDVVVVDSMSAGDSTLVTSIGRQFAAFRAVVADYAGTLRPAVSAAGEFAPTAEMRESLFQRLQQHQIRLDRPVYDAGAGLVNRVLTAQALRYARGPEAEYRYLLRESRAMQTALEIASGAPTQRALFERAKAHSR
ncbi:MAG: S41 family peptidase [Gemmatimonadaceae bacterium]